MKLTVCQFECDTSSINGSEQSAFGMLTGNVLFPDLYSTYASVGMEHGMVYSASLQVDQADPSWNLLLAELSRLGTITKQSVNDGNHESSSTAA